MHSLKHFIMRKIASVQLRRVSWNELCQSPLKSSRRLWNVTLPRMIFESQTEAKSQISISPFLPEFFHWQCVIFFSQSVQLRNVTLLWNAQNVCHVVINFMSFSISSTALKAWNMTPAQEKGKLNREFFKLSSTIFMRFFVVFEFNRAERESEFFLRGLLLRLKMNIHRISFLFSLIMSQYDTRWAQLF